MLIDLRSKAPNVPVENLKSLLSFGLAIQSADSAANLPDFPLDNVHLVAKMMVSINITTIKITYKPGFFSRRTPIQI